MTNISTIGIVGTDGVVPIYDPAAPWKMWSKDEIYLGGVGKSKYVPKVKDYVIDPDTYETWMVSYLDPVTLLPTLTVKHPANMSLSFSEVDVLFGVGPGTQPETYKALLDTSVMPYTLNVERRLHIKGNECQYCKIFKGTDVSSTGVVISKLYDASGKLLTDRIPLELVAIENTTNLSIKVVSSCKTNVSLSDNSIVTAVCYGADGVVISKTQLLIENTGFIRDVNVATSYVSHISLKSPFMSLSQDTLIEFPINMPLSALNLIGVVHYSDGSTKEYAVDGTRFSIFGLDKFVSTIENESVDLVLKYNLGTSEMAEGKVIGEGKEVTSYYKLVVTQSNPSLSVKVFGYPEWVSETLGYKMRWFLTNLDRNINFDVTDLVQFAENTGPFSPRGFGYLQEKAITLNLRDVSSAFKPFIHTQVFDIVLNSAPNGSSTPWLVCNEIGLNKSYYGADCLAKLLVPSTSNFNIKAECSSKEEWLAKVYSKIYPIVDMYDGSTPPTPTHFELSYGTNKLMCNINQWESMLSFGVQLTRYENIYIRFIKRVSTGDLDLGVAAMMITS